MERLWILASISAIVIAVTFYPSINKSFLKIFYEELVSRNVPSWKKVDVVEEKHALEDLFSKDMPWGMVELVVGGLAACVLSLFIGWRLNNYRSWYVKETEVNSMDRKILQKFSQMEKFVSTMEKRLIELQEKYAMLNTELNFSTELLEKEIPTTNKAYQPIDSELTDKGCQTSQTVSSHMISPVDQPETLQHAILVSRLKDTPEPDSVPEDVQLDLDLISNLNEDQNEKCIENLNFTTIKEEIKNNQPMDAMSSNKFATDDTDLVFNGNPADLYAVEIDVVRCDSSPSATGCGESKSRRISQYKQPPYPPLRVTTPRRYSATPNQTLCTAPSYNPATPEASDTVSGAPTNRRRKQRNNFK